MKRENLYKKPLSNLYKLAQEYFNKKIRLRDKKQRGHCITCPKEIEEAGHFEHGGNNKYSFWCDFNKKNMNGQCSQCNHYFSGKLNIYGEELEKMYGFGIIQELNALKWKPDEWTKDDLIDIIEESKQFIKNEKSN